MDGAPPKSEPKSIPIASGAANGLLILGVLYTAYFARAVLIPITMALLMSFALAPMVRAMSRRLKLPRGVAATAVVVVLLAAIGFTVSVLSKPAADWMETLPSIIVKLERKLQPIGGTVQDVQESARQVEAIAERAGSPSGDKPLPVVVRGPSLAELFVGQTMLISVGVVVTAALLLFLLASGESLLRQAVHVAPNLEEKKRVVEIARETEAEISHYLASISMINCGLGLVVGLAMWALGMPNPALWGVMVALFNFVPYIGGLASLCVITLVAIATFESLWLIALPPLTFLALNVLEGQFLTPAIVSHRLLLSPIAVLLSLIVWTWMWGVAGTLLAVPILAAFKIICERIERLQPVATLLTHQRPQAPDAE